MNRHADFDVVKIEHDRVFIVDLDVGGPSVTNDAEYVRDVIAHMYPDRRLIYRDSMGQWDEIISINDIGDIDFKCYREHTPQGV